MFLISTYIIFLMLQQISVGGEDIAKEDQDTDIKKAWLVLKCSHVICVYSRCIMFKWRNNNCY